MKTMYYFPIDGDGNEIGEPIPVTLAADGSADLSRLPTELRKALEAFGVPDALHRDAIFPKDGERFLERLIEESNGYRRFRSTPEKR